MRANPAPVAELLIMAGLFFGSVCFDLTTVIAPRVLRDNDSIRGAVERFTDEACMRLRYDDRFIEAPVLSVGEEGRVETASLIQEHEQGDLEGLAREYREPAPVELKVRATAPPPHRYFASLIRPRPEPADPPALASSRSR